MANANNVRVVTTQYVFTHSKAPRGTGFWAFMIKTDIVFTPTSCSYATAKRWAQKQAVAAGETFVTVCT